MRQSNYEMVAKALAELNQLIAIQEAMHDTTTMMRRDLNLLLELRRRFQHLLEVLPYG